MRSSSASPRLSHATSVLTSAPFGLAVALLVLNDWILKAAIGNWVTGKLSDVAGLAAFSMFMVAVLSQQRRTVFLVTGAAFVFWKSAGDAALVGGGLGAVLMGFFPENLRLPLFASGYALGALVGAVRPYERWKEAWIPE